MPKVTEIQIEHISRLLKQKFISPYKIIYMLDQKEADYFKSRNQNLGCCSASQITISKGEQTKLQRLLHEMISFSAIRTYINQLFQYCQERYSSIVDKGKQDSLKVTADVQKYLIDNILSESANKFIYNRLVQKLSTQCKSISTDIGLWATPATWYAKYPQIKLELFQPQEIGHLFNMKWAVLRKKMDALKDGSFEELRLLEKDGKFQEILWRRDKESAKTGNECKVLNNILKYGSVQGDNYFKWIIRTCVLIQSIPFELNLKANSYLTISDNPQVYYYNTTPFQCQQTNTSCKYQVLMPIGTNLQVCADDQNITVLSGDIIIIQGGVKFGFGQAKVEGEEGETKTQIAKGDAFILRCGVNQAQRKS